MLGVPFCTKDACRFYFCEGHGLMEERRRLACGPSVGDFGQQTERSGESGAAGKERINPLLGKKDGRILGHGNIHFLSLSLSQKGMT